MSLAEEIGSLAGIADPHLVGEGGFGLVYRCWEAGLGRPVAVKIARRTILDTDARRRFEDECRAAGALSGHPNVVTVHRSGFTAAGHPFLVMEYLPGGSLADQVAKRGALSVAWALRVGARVGQALQAAHDAGLLHRDLKPENILVSSFGEPMLVDFGLAQIDAGGTADGGALVTSLAHAAPELLSDGFEATVATDVYALGSTIFSLVHGAPPFWRDGEPTIYPMLARIATGAIPDLRATGAPSVFCELLESSLSRDPDQRPHTAGEFADACRDACAEMGIDPDAPLPVSVLDEGVIPAGGDPAITVALASRGQVRPPARGDSAPTIVVDGEPAAPRTVSAGRRSRVVALVAVGVALLAGLVVLIVTIPPEDGAGRQVRSLATDGATSTSAGADSTTTTTTSTTTTPEPPTSDRALQGTPAAEPPSPDGLDDFPRLTQGAQSATPPVVDPVIGDSIPAMLEPVADDEPSLEVGSDLTCRNDEGTAPIACALALGPGGWFATATWSVMAGDDDCVNVDDPSCPEITLYVGVGSGGQFDPVSRTDFANFYLGGYVLDIQTLPFTSGGEEAIAIHYATGGASNLWGYLEVAAWPEGDVPTVVAHATAETNGGLPSTHRDGILLEDFRELEMVDTYLGDDGEWMSVDL